MSNLNSQQFNEEFRRRLAAPNSKSWMDPDLYRYDMSDDEMHDIPDPPDDED